MTVDGVLLGVLCMGFGVLATVNGVGDFLSSIVVGLLWTSLGTAAAFGYAAALAAMGCLLVLRLPRAAVTGKRS